MKCNETEAGIQSETLVSAGVNSFVNSVIQYIAVSVLLWM